MPIKKKVVSLQHNNKNMDGTLNQTMKLILEHLIRNQGNEKHNH